MDVCTQHFYMSSQTLLHHGSYFHCLLTRLLVQAQVSLPVLVFLLNDVNAFLNSYSISCGSYILDLTYSLHMAGHAFCSNTVKVGCGLQMPLHETVISPA